MAAEDDGWLMRFHAGDRAALEACYRDHFEAVDGAVGRVLAGADRETVVHDVFLRLMSSESLRRSFRGGSLAAWLSTVARNQAFDYLRAHRREAAAAERSALDSATVSQSLERSSEARLLIEQFKRERLPPKWLRVFELRFERQLDQAEAASALGLSRTTLLYQEHRVRSLLRRFLLREGGA